MSLYQVWCEDRGETRMDVVGIKACDAESAVTEWAQRSDYESGDYSIANGRVVTVCVSTDGSDDVETFEVFGEAVPHYIATNLKRAVP